MKVIAAYLLSALTEEKVDEKKIKKILTSVGAQVDADRVKSLLSSLDGKDLAEIIAEGNSKLASVPSGAGAVASSGATGGAAAQDAPAAEEKEEAKEESDDDMGFGLFD